jgi:hypothetical protein
MVTINEKGLKAKSEKGFEKLQKGSKGFVNLGKKVLTKVDSI